MSILGIVQCKVSGPPLLGALNLRQNLIDITNLPSLDRGFVF